ncbi:MAG: ABC transporter substrate-binding protein [Alphaproteobacteria bacterium]|nr:ABC transporter substrate-binding protein [Alphaproteobacteria bacterium]
MHLLALALTASLAIVPAAWAQTQHLHAISIHGTPKYGPDFKQLEYVNPDAPKGGEITLGGFGTFDSLHPFILRGVPAAGSGLTYDSLMTQVGDDPDTDYGVIAESVEVPADRSWATFKLRSEARFHDGRPITAADVAWTFETLTTKGAPVYRSYYGDVSKVEVVDERRVKFSFKNLDNRELIGNVGNLRILPRHYWQERDFEKPTLEPPLGSGHYRVEAVDPGRSIRYRRVEDHWAARLPINIGRFNFGGIRYEYYRDTAVSFEAFKAGAIDFRTENESKLWAEGYDVPAVRNGLIKREEFKTLNPRRPQGFVFNLRRPQFQDRRVRQALGYAFDFEWMNKSLFFGQYAKLASYFPSSEFAATGLPQGEELAILERYRGRVPDEVFTKEYMPPTTDGSGNLRDNVRHALRLLGEAGWQIKGGKLTNAKGETFQFEIISAQAGIDRVVLPFTKNLERLGITASLRIIDTAQYSNRMDNFDFDMVLGGAQQRASPGNEQREYWGSASADTRGGVNIGGIKDPVIDELAELVINAPNRDTLVQRTRALDRVLLWGYYMIPQFYEPATRIAYWDKFGRPAVTPKYTLGFTDTWWIDPAKAANLDQRKTSIRN